MSRHAAPPEPGQPHPLGSRVREGGVNFSVFSQHATRADLLLYDHVDDDQPARVLPLQGDGHRTWHYWHVFVPGLRVGQVYAWRMHGPFDPRRGRQIGRAHV